MKHYFSTALFFSLTFLLLSISADASVSVCPFAWTKNIKIGSVSDDVLKLQQFLNASSDTAIALSGLGSVGNESPIYGPRTAKAVAKFQEKYAADTLAPASLSRGSGFVGTLTRAKLNALCAAAIVSPVSVQTEVKAVESATTTAPVAEDVLTITRPDQPAPTLAPAGAGSVPFTSITLTAGSKDVTVNSMTIERGGFGADGAFDSVAIQDADGNQIGEERGFRSNHKVDVGEPFVIPAGTSKTITVAANMVSDLSSFNGQMPVLQVVAVNTSTRVVGTLPVKGTAHTVNSTLVIGGATVVLSQFDPSVASTRYINDTSVRFSGIRLTANSKEDLTLFSIIWDQAGSAGVSDVANIVTVADGKSYPTTVSKKTFTSTFDPPIVVRKGYSVDVYVQGDLKPSAVNRTVEFNIRKSGNIAISGNSYNYYVLILPNNNTATSGHSVFITSDGTTNGNEGRPFFSGSIMTVSGGTFTSIGK